MSSNPIATNHKELIAWQLCARLRGLVLTYTRDGPARRDFKYLDQIRTAARSACYLTSEGFYRKRDGDFVNFLIWARGSLGEVGDQIDDGAECGYFTEKQRIEMIRMMKRACKANSGLKRYLEESIQKRKANRKKQLQSRPAGPARPKPSTRSQQKRYLEAPDPRTRTRTPDPGPRTRTPDPDPGPRTQTQRTLRTPSDQSDPANEERVTH